MVGETGLAAIEEGLKAGREGKEERNEVLSIDELKSSGSASEIKKRAIPEVGALPQEVTHLK
jgi:hypothetical protein